MKRTLFEPVMMLLGIIYIIFFSGFYEPFADKYILPVILALMFIGFPLYLFFASVFNSNSKRDKD